MLQALGSQIRDVRTLAVTSWDRSRCETGSNGSINYTVYDPIEVLIVYDSLEANESSIRMMLAEVDFELLAGVKVRFIPTQGLRYYQLKNEGARRARGEIIIFLDCDVLPEPNWLAGMLRPFDDPTIEGVCGNSYIPPRDLYSRAVALTWVFPLRTEDAPVRPYGKFEANNVAFRRSIFETFPFPDDIRFRGQGRSLAKTLKDNGVIIYLNPSARVAHPPPDGVNHFLRHALCDGHDRVVLSKDPLRGSFIRLASHWLKSWRKIQQQRQVVKLSAAATPLAFFTAFSYYLAFFVGELLTRIDPRIVRRYFPL